MIEEVIKIISQFTEMDTANITGQTELVNDMGLNSLDVMNIVVAFEDKFDIEIPDRIIKDFKTVGDIADYLDNIAN